MSDYRHNYFRWKLEGFIFVADMRFIYNMFGGFYSKERNELYALSNYMLELCVKKKTKIDRLKID